MKRRAFLKGVVLTVPSMWMGPNAILPVAQALLTSGVKHRSLSRYSERELIPDKVQAIDSPFIVFIDEYGRLVLDHFKPLLKAYPVLRPCYHIHQDTNLIVGFSELFAPSNAIGLVGDSVYRINPLILVFNANRDEDLFVAELFAEIYRKLTNVLSIAFVGDRSQKYRNKVFDLTLIDPTCVPSNTALLLQAIHHSYCNCSGFGNLICLKLWIHEIIDQNFNCGVLWGQLSGNKFIKKGNKEIDMWVQQHDSYSASSYSVENRRLVVFDCPKDAASPFQEIDLLRDVFSGDERFYYNHINPNPISGQYIITVIDLYQSISN